MTKKRKKLLITVGAGASLDFGLPSVSDVDGLLDRCAGHSHPLASDPTSNLYRYCRDAIQQYYDSAPKAALRNRVNFEEVIYQLNLLIPYLHDPHRLHGSNALLTSAPLPDVMEFGVDRKPASAALTTLAAQSIDALVDHFIDACATLAQKKASELAELRHFLAVLQENFEVGIITLNYDNLFTLACPGLHTGFCNTGAFDPRSVLSRRKWDFIYHLHGSVHFAMSGTAHDMHGITWEASPQKHTRVHAFGRNGQGSMEGTNFPMSPFVAGYGKTQQVLRLPFRAYFAQVNRLVYEADCLMFLGYGFGDLHLNALFSEISARPRPTVVIDWAPDDQDPLPFRHDTWTYRLFQTLPANADEMSCAGHSAPACVAELKVAHEFEVSRNPKYPLAVWYNGMLAACRNPQKVLAHLD